MANLYDLATNYQQVSNLLSEGEMDQKLLTDTLDSISETLNIKVENIVRLIRNKEADEKAVASEIKRLQSKKKSAVNSQISLKNYLQSVFETNGIPKIKTPIATVSLRKTPNKINVLDEHILPEKYLTIVEPQANKQKIKEDFKITGKLPIGVTITQSETLSIR